MGHFLLAVVALALPAQANPPRVLDPRLELVLAAEQPELVTPTGLAIEPNGRILIVESHTHFPPPNYQGPDSDRLRAAWDADGDGRCERFETVFSGTKHTMNVGVDETGQVFLATRNAIQRLGPADAQGHFTAPTVLAHLETPGNYPHNGLSGFAFDGTGWTYFGMGENLGAPYRLVGADGATISGGGEGGNIFRCRADGTRLQRVATGFWNPFHLACDALGRIFAVDNDPDSRPPCRLLHIVHGGDYGYRFRNGRRGTHPFTSWNGELPGTLPMMAGTGEAPSGILACESAALPVDYRETLLVTSWGDHRLEQFRLEPAGASYSAQRRTIVQGDEDFRPVGIAAAPNGWLYLTDWVDKAYEVHGRGRLWCLRPKGEAIANASSVLSAEEVALRERMRRYRTERAQTTPSHKPQSAEGKLAAESDPRLRAWLVEAWPMLAERSIDSWTKESMLVQAALLRTGTVRQPAAKLAPYLMSADPFLQQAARVACARGATEEELASFARDPLADLRLQALLVVRSRDEQGASELLKQFLLDPDPRVRFAAVQWVAEAHRRTFRATIADSLRQPAMTRQLLEAHLAALEMLDGVVRAPSDEWTGAQYALTLLLDPNGPRELRADLLRIVPPHQEQLARDRLWNWAHDRDARLALEAVRSLIARAEAQLPSDLIALAQDNQFDQTVRLAAVSGLDPRNPIARPVLEQLLSRPGPLQVAAIGTWRGVEPDAAARQLLQQVATQQPDLLPHIVARLSDPANPPTATWTAQQLLAMPAGDAAAGEQLLFHPRGPGCLRCHEIAGRGAAIGPSLSTATRALKRQRLIESLLDPSREVAPQFTLWNLHLADGTTRQGLRVGLEADGAERYIDPQANVFLVTTEQIESRQQTQRSLMPDGLLNALSAADVADLLAFLEALAQPLR